MASADLITSILKENLYEIFGSPSHENRLQNLARLWNPDALFIDPFGVFKTHEEVSNAISGLQQEGWVFTELSEVQVTSPRGSEIGVARLRWGYGKPGQEPELTGLDVISVKDGKVERLYTFLDSKSGN
ncbi:hypothetical protein TWF106_010752 [Orbilia oligospora]|uniref:Uncharacterized protein n=1 Tax=Orbilia oligospora TaxID=2813651 RepID=A0A7C8UQB6_ORBOL|nr:hypothetical protein TWF106_010752 [Orbilia oligospora]